MSQESLQPTGSGYLQGSLDSLTSWMQPGAGRPPPVSDNVPASTAAVQVNAEIRELYYPNRQPLLFPQSWKGSVRANPTKVHTFCGENCGWTHGGASAQADVAGRYMKASRELREAQTRELRLQDELRQRDRELSVVRGQVSLAWASPVGAAAPCGTPRRAAPSQPRARGAAGPGGRGGWPGARDPAARQGDRASARPRAAWRRGARAGARRRRCLAQGRRRRRAAGRPHLQPREPALVGAGCPPPSLPY